METIAPRKPKKGKGKFEHLSKAQKNKKIDQQVKRVKVADQRLNRSVWGRADALAKLEDVYSACYGKRMSASSLRQKSCIDLHPERLALHAKLSRYFPAHLRKEGVGMRVYETAYKFNRSLEKSGWDPFSAEELVEQMEPGRCAEVTRDYLKWAARDRDRKEIVKQYIKTRDALLTDPRAVLKKQAEWLKLIETHPAHAIGAALSTIRNDSNKMYQVNEVLKTLGCHDWWLTWDDPRYQPDMFEDEDE